MWIDFQMFLLPHLWINYVCTHYNVTISILVTLLWTCHYTTSWNLKIKAASDYWTVKRTYLLRKSASFSENFMTLVRLEYFKDRRLPTSLITSSACKRYTDFVIILPQISKWRNRRFQTSWFRMEMEERIISNTVRRFKSPTNDLYNDYNHLFIVFVNGIARLKVWFHVQ